MSSTNNDTWEEWENEIENPDVQLSGGLKIFINYKDIKSISELSVVTDINIEVIKPKIKENDRKGKIF